MNEQLPEGWGSDDYLTVRFEAGDGTISMYAICLGKVVAISLSPLAKKYHYSMYPWVAELRPGGCPAPTQNPVIFEKAMDWLKTICPTVRHVRKMVVNIKHGDMAMLKLRSIDGEEYHHLKKAM